MRPRTEQSTETPSDLLDANRKIYCNLFHKYLLFDSSDLHGEISYGR